MSDARAIANPFAVEQAGRSAPQAIAEVAQQREIAEVQAAVVMARRFPRDPTTATDAVLRACTRKTLAESALYSYSRGGSDITGPSIRLAEAMAQSWGNLAFGVRELEQISGESTVEAYCWDLETNVRQSRVFHVKHERHTKSGSYKVSDPRDVYEIAANQGARRLRACILGVIPGDVVEAAVAQCEETMRASADTSPEGLKKMIDTFKQFGVTQQQIEARCQCRAEAIRPAQVIQLRKIYASLKDGMSGARDWFPDAVIPAQQTGSQLDHFAQVVAPPHDPETGEIIEHEQAPPDAPALADSSPPAAARTVPRAAVQESARDQKPRARDENWWNSEKLVVTGKTNTEFQAAMHSRIREARNWAEIERLRDDAGERIDVLDKATREAVLGELADREKELRANA